VTKESSFIDAFANDRRFCWVSINHHENEPSS
jgi:hypothetical protein